MTGFGQMRLASASRRRCSRRDAVLVFLAVCCLSRGTSLLTLMYSSSFSSAGPEMISGVRASSMRIESTSSTIANASPRCTRSFEAEREVVAQVVEAEFVVGAVGDVAAVRGALLGRVLLVADHADGEAEEAVDRAHPVRVARRQVFVDGDDVDAFARSAR